MSEQNEILVQTIEDLENDSNEKVLSLENKLINTSELLKVRILISFQKVQDFDFECSHFDFGHFSESWTVMNVKPLLGE